MARGRRDLDYSSVYAFGRRGKSGPLGDQPAAWYVAAMTTMQIIGIGLGTAGFTAGVMIALRRHERGQRVGFALPLAALTTVSAVAIFALTAGF